MSAIIINPSTKQLVQFQGKIWIVLVGVNHYQVPQIPDLRYCANDCKELAETLKIVTQQFQETEIIALYDGGEKPPNKLEINNSIQSFRLAKPEDTVLFYFSGHGYLDSNNRPILCVTDTSLEDLAETGLKLDTLLNELRQCKAQRQLVWLDACQERERQQDDIIRQNPTSQLLAVLEQQAEQSQDFYAMLSCNKTERSWEIPELKHGLFTYCLIEGLRGKAANTEGKIDADSLFKYVERNSKKFIEYKKNTLNEHSFSKGMLGNLKEYSTKLKIKQLPSDASQTPQRIARGSGELIIGLATFNIQKKAIIIDGLSSSLVDISLCKILKARGNFEVDYCFVREKQRRNIQQIITSYLQEESNQTVLLYLAGTIESTNPEKYELICNQDNRINLNWLGQQLQDSPVREIVIIADILDTSGTNKSLVEILQPSQDKSLCLITVTTSVANNKKLLHELVTVLETAGELEREFWVAELITQLQKWGVSQGDVNFKLWLSGSTELMDILSVEAQRSYNEIFEIDVCPYKSLEAFTQDDAYFFHGREELIAEIIEKLQLTSFLAIVGASGSGKSSVVRAGVIPQLVTEGLFDSELEQSKSCQSWVMLPGDNPLAALAKTLAPDNPDFLEGVLHLGVDSLVQWLRQQSKEISVLVIDQFEEIFTSTLDTDRLNYINLIVGAIKEAGDCFKVVITLRDDFLKNCLATGSLAPLVRQSTVLVPSYLTEEEYRQILEKPAHKVGLIIENVLVNVLLQELQTESLPLLQFALEELWDKRTPGQLTLENYQQNVGGLGEILGRKAQETYQRLNEKQQQCAQMIFESLVLLGEGKEDTRRRIPISKLQIAKYRDVLDFTLKALIDARLLVVSSDINNPFISYSFNNFPTLEAVSSDEFSSIEKRQNDFLSKLQIEQFKNTENNNQPDSNISSYSLAIKDENRENKTTVEIAHEILIRKWKTLRWWLDTNRNQIRLIRELERKADEWKQTPGSQKDDFLLSEAELVKYRELYVDFADQLLPEVHQFIELSIEKHERIKKQDEIRRTRELENEINYLLKASEALLLLEKEFDALIIALWAGRKSKKTTLQISPKTRIKIVGVLQNIFSKTKEFNRLEGHNNNVNTVVFSPDGQTIVTASSDSTVKLWNRQGKLLQTLTDHTDCINCVVFSPDGQIIATASEDKTAKLWNKQGKLLYTLNGHAKSVNGVVFSPSGQTIATTSWDGTVKLWNRQGQLLHNLEDNNVVAQSVVFSPDGQTVAFNNKNPFSSNSYDSTVKLWNLQGELLYTLQGHTSFVSGVAFSPDGRIIATASSDQTVKLWNLQGELLHTLQGHTNEVRKVVFSPNGQIIASMSQDRTVRLWDLQNLLFYTLSHINSVNNVAFSPDSQTLASANQEGTVKLWSIKGELLHTFKCHTDEVNNVVFSPDGQILASASNDKSVKIWNIKDELIPTLKGRATSVTSIAFSPNEQILVSTGYDKTSENGTVELWDRQGQLLQTLVDHTRCVDAVAFSPDGQTLASASDDCTVKLWNRQGQLLHTLQGHTDKVNTVMFSPDGETLASTSTPDFNKILNKTDDGDSKAVKLWSKQGRLLRILGHQTQITSVRFNFDGQILASASWDGIIKLWNRRGDLLHTLEGHTDKVNSLELSPDGQILASASWDGTVKLWNWQGNLLYTLEGHTDGVNKAIFSPDGETLASASKDKTIKLWNFQGQILSTLEGHTKSVEIIVFSPNSHILASSSDDHTIKLWNLQGEFLHTFEDHLYGGVKSLEFSPDGQTLASVDSYGRTTVKLWSLDLDDVMSRGCGWIRDYLTNNPKVSEEDRKICDGIGSE